PTRCSCCFPLFVERPPPGPGAAIPSCARCVGLSEPVKDIGHEIRWDAFTRVTYGDADVRVYALQARFDVTALWRELDRVGKQVPNHLLQADVVACDLSDFGWEVDLERDAFGARRRVDRLNRFLDHRDQVHRSDIEPELAADD